MLRSTPYISPQFLINIRSEREARKTQTHKRSVTAPPPQQVR
jgi:hypothetical protein